jgi:hypothetical protein
VVGVTVGDKQIADFCYRCSKFVKSLGALCTAVHQKMVIPLYDKKIRLIFPFGEGASDTNKKKL